jgi:hypothetical protein
LLATDPSTSEAPTAAAVRPILGHVLGLAIVLLALVPLLGRDGLFSADEGAAASQARLLADGDGWVLDHPAPELDPEGTAFPLENAGLVQRDGNPGGAPFSKHPAYAVLLAAFDVDDGLVGMTLTSVAGTVLAAAMTGLLTRRLAPDLGPIAVWVAGLATPLFFDSWILIAHTLAAGLAALATLAVLRSDEGRGGPAILTAAAAMAGAVLLRNEAALFGGALAVVAVGLAVRDRRRSMAVAGMAALAGAVGGYLIDGALSAAVSADADGAFSAGIGVGDSGFVGGRILGALVTLVLPSYGTIGLADGLLVVATGALVAAVVIARRRPDDRDGVIVFVALAVLAAGARAVIAPEVVPGLLLAAPALTAGLVAVDRRVLRSRPAQLLAATAGIFVAGVLATQYSTGGSGEWGGRYFALALPLLVPLVVVACRDLVARWPQDSARPLLAGLVLVPLALTLLGGRALVASEDRSTRIVDAIERTADDLEQPIVVATSGAPPRFAWRQVLAGDDWLLIPVEDLDGRLDALADTGRDVVVATTDPAAVRALTGSFRTRSDALVAPGSAWTILGLEAIGGGPLTPSGNP